MATDVDQAYQEWSQEELSDGDESHEISVSPMLDHGSISFGRFPIESLSWERRSVFTHNRCQEELEKFNGLVAKKKAYFEERYRRIRAMKAQQNQQTELTLDYSGDGSISSQSGEEDGAALQHESQTDGAANIVHPISEEAEHGAGFEWESNCNEPLQERCLDPKSTLPNLTSSREISENTNKNSVDTVLVQPMETESSLPLRGDVKAIESNCSSNLGNKEILQKPENLVSNFDPRRVTHGTALDANKTKLNQLQSCRKSLSYKPLSNVKDSAAVRNGLNVKRETKLNVVQSSKGLKTPSQKMVGQTLSKTTASARSTLVASNGPLTEARSRITTPGPFTFVMERRASSRGSAAKHDSGGSNKLSSSLSHAEGGLSAQDMLKKTAATSGMTRRRGPDIKRDLKEVRNKPLVVDSRYTSLKKIEAHVLGPPKSRSINLPARNKPTSNGGTESQIATTKGTKQKEGNARMREFLRVTAKTTGPSMAGSMRMGTKKATQEADISHTGRTPRLDNLSLDGKKTRRDVPQWRCLKL